MKITPQLIQDHGLKPDEYERIVQILGREPNLTELGVYSVMWSEHCGYKHSRALLKKLPTQGKKVLQGPGENAGILDVGNGWAVVFKIESHNHPSAVEPYQGAATGVGGILRDIFTMGARPIAILNALRFGPLSNLKSRQLLTGVIRGIADYGNCMGIPTVAGEVSFDDSYLDNCLVNAMCVGVIRHDKIIKGVASGVENSVIYIGATTGRDGIHGATFASTEISEKSQEKRSAVQVADPFMEKLLMEATLELIEKNLLIGIQDMGAAGLTCSTCEMASRGNMGIEIDVSKVPLRELKMNPYEILLSESQERMLLVAKPGCEAEIHSILKKWDLNAATIGKVTETGLMVVKHEGEKVVEVPAQSLTDPPMYHPQKLEPAFLAEYRSFRESSIPVPTNFNQILLRLLADPTIASKQFIYQQYDHMVQTNTIVLPGSDAAVLRIKETNQGLAMSVDGNGIYCLLNPYEGGKIAVAEAARNVACSGAVPIGLTNCLNFGNPEKPEVFYMFEKVVEGMSDASVALEIPITGGNVSFYNESQLGPIDPTPIIGVIGVLDDVSKHVTQWFKKSGDLIYLIGEVNDLIGGSRYLQVVHGKKTGICPTIDLKNAKLLYQCLNELANKRLIQSAHDCSEGGLAVAISECCFTGIACGKPLIGAKINMAWHGRMDGILFGESQSRVLISFSPQEKKLVDQILSTYGMTFQQIGVVGGSQLLIEQAVQIDVEYIAEQFFSSLEHQVNSGGKA
jgi:phosphoribosylformylglycinamidine synthase